MNTTDYLVRFHNTHKVNKAFNGITITRGVQEHGMKILYLLYVTGFDALQDNGNKEAEIAGEEMLYTILYLKNSDKARFDYLNKRVENKYVFNKLE